MVVLEGIQQAFQLLVLVALVAVEQEGCQEDVEIFLQFFLHKEIMEVQASVVAAAAAAVVVVALAIVHLVLEDILEEMVVLD